MYAFVCVISAHTVITVINIMGKKPQENTIIKMLKLNEAAAVEKKFIHQQNLRMRNDDDHILHFVGISYVM